MEQNAPAGILEPSSAARRETILQLLRTAYWNEIETVMNCVANSVNPDGVGAEVVRRALAEGAADGLDHAERFAARIKELYGKVPGSEEFEAGQRAFQPPSPSTNIASLLHGAISVKDEAIVLCGRLLEATQGVDPVTEHLVVEVLRDEQASKRRFESFLKEYQGQGIGLA
ncbi:MAG: ferritin-like domain-containing protein [Miltoncostaeaceae bacterium]